MILSGVPLPFIFRRSLIVIPFVLFVALISVAQGPIVILTILIKSWLCILSMIVLASTTRFPELLKAFESLRLPRVIVMLMSFMYRYIFVVVDEIMRMKKARDSRSFGGNRRWHIRTAGSMIGALFLRTYERGERIYISMASRGFTGKIKILKDFQISRGDLLFALPFFSSLLAVRLIV
jgi:cobalt/nickel transport system permease protein